MNQVEISKRQTEIISYVLEMIILLVLGNMLGDNGIAYIALAVESLMLIWTLTGLKVADVLGKLLHFRSSRGQYKNAKKLWKNALFLQSIAGLVGSIVLYAAAGFLGRSLFGLVYSVAIIRILAPVVFLRAMVSGLLGYFQGEGTEIPSEISYVMRQLCILIFSVIFAKLFGAYGNKVSALLRQDNFTAMYGGMGVALAFVVAEILVLLFLFLVYRESRKTAKKSAGEGMRTTDTFGSQVIALYGSLLLPVSTALLQQLPIWLGMIFFGRSLEDVNAFNGYGVFYGKYLPLVGIAFLPAWALLLGNVYKVAGCVRKEEQRYARGNFSGGLHMAVIYGMFFSVYMTALAPQLAEVFCGTQAELAARMLRCGSFMVLLSVIGFYFSETLLLLGGTLQALGTFALYDLVYVIGALLFLKNGSMGVMALIYAGLIAGAVHVVAAGVLLFYQMRMGFDWLQGIAIPAATACVMGLLLLFAAKFITLYLGSLVTAILCLALGQIFYWVMLLLIHNFGAQELNYIPGGSLIRKLGQLFKAF